MRWMTLLLLPALALAHDEGHGPVLEDQPKRGGVVAAVRQGAGHHGKTVLKAELVRSEGGLVRLYLYDLGMKPLALEGFSPDAKAVVETGKKGKWKKQPFALKLKDGVYSGTAPKPARKPFNIDVELKQGKQALTCSFENLD